ncbi:MAG: aromatic compound degradation protein PaaI [Micrococcales bacterium]|nr:aromatic compound degradation protein PaaI [Micrococcales bacterium]
MSFDREAAAAMLNDNLGELATTMGIHITSASPEEVRATMPVEGNRQPYGLLHGGGSAVLAETLGSIHSALLAPTGTAPVGIELSCSHHRSARSGTVTAVCRPINSGRTLATMGITITDDQDRVLCTSRLSCLFRDTQAGL